MSLTMHYITEDIEKTSIALCTPSEARQTGENIAKGTKAILDRHGTARKVIKGAVTDDAMSSPGYAT